MIQETQLRVIEAEPDDTGTGKLAS